MKNLTRLQTRGVGVLLTLGFVQSFHVPCWKPIGFSSNSLSARWMSEEDTTEHLPANGDENLADILAIPNSTKRRRKRSADFPSFSYEISSRPPKNKNKEPVGMKYKGCGCENVKFRKPPTVIIPDDDADDMGLLGKAAVGLAGGFEGGLGSIGLSASRTRLLKNRAYAKKEGMFNQILRGATRKVNI